MDSFDTDAIRAYLAGDENALEPLVEKYKRPLYSFILKMTEGREDADEIFQETWFRVLKNIHKFQHTNFLNWMFRIAHNYMIDRVRRNKKYVSIQGGGSYGNEEDERTLEDRLPASGITPSEEVSGFQLGERIEKAIETLSLEQKEVFLMRMYSDISFKEIAKIQHCSINTCLARMQYALGNLRSMLEDEYENL